MSGAPDRDWTAVADAAWIQLSALQGRAPSKVQVSIVITDLTTGVYNGQVTFTSGQGVQRIVQVTLSLGSEVIPPSPPPLTITTTSLPLGTAGTAYSAALSTSGGRTPCTWSVVGGSLPSGLAISQGSIGGTPSASGQFNFTVQASDLSSPPQTATANLAIQIADPAQTRTVLWSADYETGNPSQWYAPSTGPTGDYGGAEATYNSGTVRVTRSYAHSGSSALEMTITTPPESAARMLRWREPQSVPGLFYSAWYYFPQAYSVPHYWNVFAWESYRPTAAQTDPFFILNVGNRSNGAMYFYLFDWQRRVTYSQSAKNIPVGQWFQVEAFYQCAGDGSGRVTFWQDGTLLMDVPNVQTRYADGNCQWNINSYSDGLSPATATIYTDDASISTSSTQIVSPTPTPTPTPVALVIATTGLPSGTRGTAYSATLAASGGTAPYTWTIAGGQLPPGLSLSGQGGISGTPSNSGLFNFSVQAQDSASTRQSATANFAIQVADPGPVAPGTTYYIDAGGSDSNSGTTPANPWKTVAKVNGFGFSPGDQVLFRRGQTWTGPLAITRSGSNGAPITFGAYDTGNAPLISGSNHSAPSRGSGLINVSASYIAIDGLRSSYSGGYGVYIIGNRSNVTIQNCEVDNSNDGGIVFEGGSNMLVSGCKVHDTNSLGGGAWHEAISMANVNGFEVKNNEVYNGGEEGIDAKYGASNGSIHDNWVHDNNGPEIYIDAAHDLQIYGNTLSGSAPDKTGLGISIESTYNPNHLNTYNLTIRNNVIYDNGSGIWLWLESGAETFANVYGIQILNNTIIDNNRNTWSGGIYFMPGGSSNNFTSGNVIKNNIIYSNTQSSGAKVINNGSGAASRFTISNNMIKSGEPSDVANANQVATTSPGFANAGARDYRLTSSSPAIGAGTNVGLPYSGSAPDIGAYEFVP